MLLLGGGLATSSSQLIRGSQSCHRLTDLAAAVLLGVCCSLCAGAGGSAAAPSSASTPCPEGLETKFTGAKSVAQCFTKLGYGRKATRNPTTGVVTYSGVLCAVATYNVGGNTAGCQKCGAGLTTNGTGKGNAATDCCKHLRTQLCSGFSCGNSAVLEYLSRQSL